MIVNIDLENSIPIYEQLKEQIVQGILKQNIMAGEKLPSVRQLASDLEINMHTVNKVYKILENEGFISINKKKGAFINVNSKKLALIYTQEKLLKDIELKILLHKEIYKSLQPIKDMFNDLEVKGNE